MPSVSMCYGCEFRWWYMQSEWRHAFGVSCLLDCGFLGFAGAPFSWPFWFILITSNGSSWLLDAMRASFGTKC